MLTIRRALLAVAILVTVAHGKILGSKCLRNGDCTCHDVNSFCEKLSGCEVGNCRCKSDYYNIAGTCAKATKISKGGPCNTTDLSRTCEGVETTLVTCRNCSTGDDGYKCRKIAHGDRIQLTCTKNIECSSAYPDSVCVSGGCDSGQCQCKPYLYVKDGKCIAATTIAKGDVCDQTDTGTVCDGSATGLTRCEECPHTKEREYRCRSKVSSAHVTTAQLGLTALLALSFLYQVFF